MIDRCLAAILAAVAVYLGFAGSTRSFSPADENFYVRATQSIVYDGRLLVPHLESQPFYNKPPLEMWASAVVVRLFGSRPTAPASPPLETKVVELSTSAQHT